MPFEGEQNECGEVGGGVEQFGAGRRVQKVVPEPAHKQEHQKTAGAGPKKTVVKPYQQPNGAGRQHLGAALQARCVVLAQVFFGQGVHQHRQQDAGQQFAQKVGRHDGHQPRTTERRRKTHRSGGQHGGPADLHTAAELPSGSGRAPNRRTFVGAEQGGRVRGGKHRKQRGRENQPPAAHDRIDKTGQQRGQRHNNPFHARDCRTDACYVIRS